MIKSTVHRCYARCYTLNRILPPPSRVIQFSKAGVIAPGGRGAMLSSGKTHIYAFLTALSSCLKSRL